MNRVVVTGIGLVCPVGLTANESWNNLKKGLSGIAPISHFDASLFPSQIAGEVKNFDPLNFMDAKEVKKSDRFIHLAIASACEAWDQSGLKQGSFDPERAGCIMGVGIGGLEMWEKYHEVLLKDGPRRISPFLIPGMISNLVPGQLAIRFNLKGPNFTITSACASSAHSVGESFKMIQRGLLDIVVTGGSEAAVTPLGVGGFSALRALSTRNNEPEKASRPWDKSRDGFVIAEGAGVLILENYDHALRRDAKILAEIIGYSCNCDAYHPTAPSENGEGAETCMKSCLKDANISTSSVDYINAHGTSTPLGDMIELEAIKRVFTKDLNRVSISSTKSMTGHLLGAAGALESIVCIMSILDNFVPPTINLEDIEDGAKDCDLVPNVGKFKEVRVALNNSFGFGGTNACIAFKKFDDRSK
ncbi:MAG: beta-ketoacyl-ACP synthase II [Deltaproteobacteria bacterium]|nr:beta-ketoacyl-ACP synthase II [Deltaproteobacteria bacterium]